jgi:hypothetical protein
VLSRFDEYCIHQTPETIRQPATSDPNTYDRWWFSGFRGDGSLYFAAAMARYPNRFVFDGAFTVAVDGAQYSFFGSRLAPDDPAETRIGPYELDVLAPMQTIRLVLEPNDSGIEVDLTFRARTAPVEEDRAIRRRDGMIHQDTTRFTQFGRWEGWISVDGDVIDVDLETTFGTRDRSWGVRSVGEPMGGRPGTGTGVFWNWLPMHFQDRCVHAWRFDDPDGRALQQECLVVPTRPMDEPVPMDDPAVEHLASWSHDYRIAPGCRYIDGGELTLVHRDGHTSTLHIGRPKTRAWPTGIGYMHPTWGHGVWHGELAFGHERWKAADVDVSRGQYQLVHGIADVELDGESGVAILEQTCFGPYAPYGFVGATRVSR